MLLVCISPEIQRARVDLHRNVYKYLVEEADGGLVEVAREGDLMVADGVKQLVLILSTEWRLQHRDNTPLNSHIYSVSSATLLTKPRATKNLPNTYV